MSKKLQVKICFYFYLNPYHYLYTKYILEATNGYIATSSSFQTASFPDLFSSTENLSPKTSIQTPKNIQVTENSHPLEFIKSTKNTIVLSHQGLV